MRRCADGTVVGRNRHAAAALALFFAAKALCVLDAFEVAALRALLVFKELLQGFLLSAQHVGVARRPWHRRQWDDDRRLDTLRPGAGCRQNERKKSRNEGFR